MINDVQVSATYDSTHNLIYYDIISLKPSQILPTDCWLWDISIPSGLTLSTANDAVRDSSNNPNKVYNTPMPTISDTKWDPVYQKFDGLDQGNVKHYGISFNGAGDGSYRVAHVVLKVTGTPNPSDPIYYAHAAWRPNTIDEGSGWVKSGPQNPPTSVPEFPTMALPVAAVLGLLFITQRKRKEE